MSKTTEKLMVVLFVILVTFAFSQNAYGQYPLNVTVTTDRESYGIMDEVLVTGNLKLNGAPVSDGLVAIQVDDPENNLLVIRTRPTGADAGQWSVEILEVIPCDQGGNPKDSFRRGGYAGFKVTIKNNDLSAHHDVTVTLNAYDRYEAPFVALIIYSGSIDASASITVMNWPVYIPGNAPVGNAVVYASVLTQLPKDGGFAYSPEKTATLTITSGSTSTVVSTQTTQSASEEGTYNLTFRIGRYEAKLGNYTVYVCSFYEIWRITNSTTFEAVLIGDITGPEDIPDGIVDIDDVMFVAVRFGSYPGHDVGLGWDPRADITGPEDVPDCLIDIDDVILVAIHFGEFL